MSPIPVPLLRDRSSLDDRNLSKIRSISLSFMPVAIVFNNDFCIVVQWITFEELLTEFI